MRHLPFIILIAIFPYVNTLHAERWFVKNMVIESDGAFVRKDFTYNIDGNVTLQTVTKSADGYNWEDSAYVVCGYEGRQLISTTIRTLSEIGWDERLKVSYMYDGGNLTYERITVTDSDSSAVTAESQTDYRNGLPERRISRHTNWSYTQTDFLYDAGGSIKTITIVQTAGTDTTGTFRIAFSGEFPESNDTVTFYDIQDGETVEAYRTIRTSCKSNHKQVDIMQSLVAGAWFNTARTEYCYNDGGNISSEIHYVWRTEFWMPDYKTEYSYDDSGHLIENTSYSHNGQRWREQHRCTFAYSGDNMTAGECLLSFWAEESAYEDFMPLSANFTGQYGYGRKISAEYYWPFEQTDGEDGTEDVAIYPNPSPTGLFYIDGTTAVENVSLYSLSGTLLFSGVPLDGNVIDLTAYSAGIYIAVLEYQGGRTVKKIIKTDL